MVYSYTPTYYSTLHDSITSLCKNLLPFGFRRRRLPDSDHRLWKLQSDNLKWQQESFHQMLNLMGLHREGILAQTEVTIFANHLLESLIASPPQHEHPTILRDKLLFLQELLYAKCISEEEYHASKRPLIQRLAVQGAEIKAKDVIVAGLNSSEQEWSVIDLRDEHCLLNQENSDSQNKSKIKGAASVFRFGSSHKSRKNGTEKSVFDSLSLHLSNSTPSKSSSSVSAKTELEYYKENSFWNGQAKNQKSEDKLKRKPFRTLFHREQREGHGGHKSRERAGRSAKKQLKNNDSDDETAPLPLNDRSDTGTYVASPQGEEHETKLMTKNLHADSSPSGFSIDKVSGGKNMEFSRIQTLSTDPDNKFPSRCDKYRDAALEVKKSCKSNIAEIEYTCNNIGKEKHSYSTQWTTFEDDENLHPNLFVHQDSSFRSSSGINPFSL